MTSDRAVTQILTVLGVQKPLWQRQWISEKELADIVRDHRELAAALDRLARDPNVELRLRRSGEEHYWLLERVGPGHQSHGAPEGKVDCDDEPDLKHSTAGNEPSRATASFPRPSDRPISSGPCPTPAITAKAHQPKDSHPQTAPTTLPTRPQDLHRVLRSLGIDVMGDPLAPQVGPTIVRYRVPVGPGVRIDSLRRCSEDISRALRSEVFVTHLPGEPFIAIDFPRPDRQVLPLLPAIEALPTTTADLWLPLGMTPEGARIELALVRAPHILIAGATDSGKSVLLQSLILSLILRLSPEDLKILLIDVKSTDFGAFAQLPHLRNGEIISDPDHAIEILQSLTGEELANRTAILRKAGCSNWRELLALSPAPGLNNIVVVIDEFADLITVLPRQDRNALEREILRLAQRARAVGIYLIVATQRPSKEFLSGAIKANFPCRISFRLPSRIDSHVILDQGGAEKLLGSGDMLLMQDGKLQRLQGYFIPISQQADLIASKYPMTGKHRGQP
jgi:DNA segregation ATPase FtsK/SpoIIIE-like protein